MHVVKVGNNVLYVFDKCVMMTIYKGFNNPCRITSKSPSNEINTNVDYIVFMRISFL